MVVTRYGLCQGVQATLSPVVRRSHWLEKQPEAGGYRLNRTTSVALVPGNEYQVSTQY